MRCGENKIGDQALPADKPSKKTKSFVYNLRSVSQKRGGEFENKLSPRSGILKMRNWYRRMCMLIDGNSQRHKAVVDCQGRAHKAKVFNHSKAATRHSIYLLAPTIICHTDTRKKGYIVVCPRKRHSLDVLCARLTWENHLLFLYQPSGFTSLDAF